MSSNIVYTDFNDKSSPSGENSFAVQTLGDIAAEFDLPNLVDAYNKGEETVLMEAKDRDADVKVIIFPYDEPTYGSLRDKGFRLRVAVEDPNEEDPYHFEIFFEEMKPGLLRQNGFFMPRDEHGGMMIPRMVNETIKAITRKLIEYKPIPINLSPDWSP